MSATAKPAAPHETTETRRLRVYRYTHGDGGEHFDEFEVPVGPRTTVLDALRWIQLHRDPSLCLRHSCLHASCGTCGVQVDGREELACVCLVADHGEEITVEPLANLPVLSDLVVDMDDFFARFPDEHPIIRASEAPEGAEPPDDIGQFVRLEDCIECGLCLSACPIVGSDPRYLGPAALAAAWRAIEEPRGGDASALLRLTDDGQGSWRCHAVFECSEACPSNVDPAGKIMLLRRAQAAAHLRSIFGGRGGS
ncbi:MAG: succinate dehydrogenase/fumarate reductase iron-sulfur subunit [Candidatus Limnocylindria bacterium]